eukprot:1159139-Pelagomonas_calceolata.AAC.13
MPVLQARAAAPMCVHVHTMHVRSGPPIRCDHTGWGGFGSTGATGSIGLDAGAASTRSSTCVFTHFVCMCGQDSPSDVCMKGGAMLVPQGPQAPGRMLQKSKVKCKRISPVLFFTGWGGFGSTGATGTGLDAGAASTRSSTVGSIGSIGSSLATGGPALTQRPPYTRPRSVVRSLEPTLSGAASQSGHRL